MSYRDDDDYPEDDGPDRYNGPMGIFEDYEFCDTDAPKQEYDRNQDREAWDDARSEDFRCYGCEVNLGRGGYCDKCREELGFMREED